MGEIWFKQGDHFAVHRFNDRNDIGVLYMPEGSLMVASGDLIVRDRDGIFRLGDKVEKNLVSDADIDVVFSEISPDLIVEQAYAKDGETTLDSGTFDVADSAAIAC